MHSSTIKYTSISTNEFDYQKKNVRIFVFCIWLAWDKMLMIKIEYQENIVLNKCLYLNIENILRLDSVISITSRSRKILSFLKIALTLKATWEHILYSNTLRFVNYGILISSMIIENTSMLYLILEKINFTGIF